jgi:prevent-host-death family protein
MKLTNRVKPISYLKANATEIIRELGEGAEPLVITQRGEAQAVLINEQR